MNQHLPYWKHTRPLVVAERLGHLEIPNGTPPTPSVHSSATPPLCPIPWFCQQSIQWHTRPPFMICRSEWSPTSHLPGIHLPVEASMESVYPTKHNYFCDSFSTVAEKISKVIYTSISSSTDGNRKKWDKFCGEVELYPLLILYHDPEPFINAVKWYLTWILDSGHHIMHSH